MAVTKTHPIKSTLKAAIDYICNPEKTDGKLLVSSYGCAAETADIEFAWTRRHAIDKGTNLGRHLIQAFQPGEVTPEQAHEIGMELAREILGGRYEFVLTTHIDRDHVHNHLIFNAVSFADHKHYHSNKRSYHFIRRTSDRLCKEHGLSVIVPGQDRGKSYIEHQAERAGTSYKAKLRAAIDRLLPGCHDLEELLVRLQREGYALKRGKYISARAPGQERFTRLKTLGADYAEDALTARMAGRARPSRQPKQRGGRVSLLIDIQNNIKAQQSAGYRHWATIENLKRIAETNNFLTEHGIGSMEELTERCEAASASAARLKNEDTNDFEGGEPHDKRRGLKRLFPQDHPAGGVGRAAVLHLPLRLRKERGAGLSLALDPLRAAVWDLAAAALDHTGRRLSGRRDRPVPSELRLCRPYRRLRPCLAAAGGGVVCAADAVPPADGGL